jgi:hypothetical protein
MSDSPQSAVAPVAGRRLGLSTLVAVAVCAGMLAIAVFVPPREGGAATPERGLVDGAGWSRLGSLERGDLRVDILSRDGERRYTVRRDGRVVGERITADELLRRWDVDTRSLRADGDGPGPMMMVDPDAAALMGR